MLGMLGMLGDVVNHCDAAGAAEGLGSAGMDLFESAGTDDAGLPMDARAPLAVRMRPRSLDEVVGQDHLLGTRSPLRRSSTCPKVRSAARVCRALSCGASGYGEDDLGLSRRQGQRTPLRRTVGGERRVKDIRQVVTDGQAQARRRRGDRALRR